MSQLPFSVGMVVELTEDVHIIAHPMVASYADRKLNKGRRGVINSVQHAPVGMHAVKFAPTGMIVMIAAKQMRPVQVDTAPEFKKGDVVEFVERAYSELGWIEKGTRATVDLECVGALVGLRIDVRAHNAHILFEKRVIKHAETELQVACRVLNEQLESESARHRTQMESAERTIDRLRGAIRRRDSAFDLLTKQRDAAYAALDDVLSLANKWKAWPCSDEVNQGGDELLDLLLKHGVHPK